MRFSLVKILSLIYKVTLIVTFVLFAGGRVYGQFISNAVVGNYENASSWNGTQPPAGGNDYRTLTIVGGAVITKSSAFEGLGAVTVDGTFNVNGNFKSGYGGTIVNGSLIVEGFFDGNLTVGSGATVRVKSFTGGTFDVKNGGRLIVENDTCTLTNNSIIENNGKVEIFGDLKLQSDIKVHYGGVLIVHGSFNAVGNWGMNISGNVVVSGDFSVSNGTIENNGNVVIGGNFSHAGGGFGGTSNNNFYIINPDAKINPSSWTSYGNLDDFIENENNNSVLTQQVEELMPGLFNSSDGSTMVFTFSGTYIVPDNVYWLTVECWGGGGGGGFARSLNGAAGGGGGGGAYSIATIPVIPGTAYPVTVGAGGVGGTTGGTAATGGGTSRFGNLVSANGGHGGTGTSIISGASGGSGGTGGTYSGGNGANGMSGTGSARGGGGGGGSAGIDSGGNNGSGITGAAAVTGGGAGGNGGQNSIGGAGTFPGGGGAGGHRNNNNNAGGDGAGGQVIISWSTASFTNSGTYTYIVPDGVYWLTVECWGGGGGGGFGRSTRGAAGGGGGGGAYSIVTIPVIPGTAYPVTVGAGGVGGTTGGTAATGGGTSRFGNLVSANGGNRGTGASSNTGAAGGSGGTGGTFGGGNGAGGVNGTSGTSGGGGGGGSAGTALNGNNAIGRNGGTAVTGGGGGGNGSRYASGNPGLSPGGGGAGAHRNNTNLAGGNGADGQVRITVPTNVYYSTGSGNPASTSSWRNSLNQPPPNFSTPNQIFVIQSGHNMATSGTWSITGANSAIHILNGGTLTENNNITLPATGILRIDAGGTLNHNVNAQAIFNGTEMLDGASTINYGFSGNQTVVALDYGNLTISGSGNKTLGGHTRINGKLTLNNVLSLGNYNLTLGSGATVEGTFSSSRMINIGNRSIIKEGNQNTDFILTLPIGLGTAYTPVVISGLTVTNIAPASSITVRTAASAASGVPGFSPLNRHWITSTNGFSGSLLANISFAYLPSDIPPGGVAGQYEIVYKPTTGDWVKPAGASAAGSNPLRSSAATTLDATWSGSMTMFRTFYSYKSGSWDDPTTWTLDPSGMQFLNPDSYTPSTSPSASADEVVVLSGNTVTLSVNNRSNSSLTVDGTLDLGTTAGHAFITISGTGRIRLAGDNFPAGDAAGFTSQGSGEGTVEYYGNSRNLTNPRTFYNVELNMSDDNILTLLTDYVINGDFIISNGTFSINNNNTSGTRTITVYGNVTVEPAGKIITGTRNARHRLNIYGDFINDGEAKFTNRTSPGYTSEATDGIVDVNFLNGDRNQDIICRGITNFYRIEIDKGTDYTYILNIEATSAGYFNLLGYANENHGSTSQLTKNNNALGLARGTVRIGNNVEIAVLSNAATYNISEAAQLWIDKGTVSKNSGTALVVYGKIKVTGGNLATDITGGITFRQNGTLGVDGGEVNTRQIKTEATGTGNYGGYVQTGGAVNVTGGTIQSGYYLFTLPYPSSVFNMSGGTLKVNTTTNNGSILINSSPENYNVTGGTVIAETQSNQDFRITSTAPFWNLELRNSGTAARQFTLTAATGIGSANLSVPVQPLQVLNHLRLWGTESGGQSYPAVIFNPSTTDVYIGGSFFIEEGARYLPLTGGTPPYDNNPPTGRNTTWFIKTAATRPVEELYQGDTSNPLEFGNLTVDRTNGYEVRLSAPSARINETVILDVNGTASVLSGTLNQNLFTIRTWGAVINNDRMGTWYPGTTPSRAQIQFVENPSLTLSTAPDAVFGNVQVNVTPPAVLTLTSDVYMERMEYVKGLIYLKGYNLKIDNLWNLDPGIFQNVPATSFLRVLNNGRSGSSMIFTDGKASDGGLTLRIGANSQAENENNILNNFGPVTYPLGFTPNGGTTLYFRPAQMVVKNYSTPGYITIRPVMGPLQTTNQAGGQLLQHYWRISHSGFTSLPTVSYRFYYRYQTGVPNVDLSSTANENTYVPGKVLDESPYTRQSETANDIIRNLTETNSRAITVNGTSTGGLFSPSAAGITLENANYTAGVPNRFTGSVLIYYTRDYAQEARWNVNQTWTRSDILNLSYDPHDSRQPAASSIPGPGDVAVIGWIPWNDTGRGTALRGQPHGVWITDSRQVAEVVFTRMTDVNGNPVPRNYRSNFQFRPTLAINARDGDNGILTAKLVKGEGLFWNRGSDPDYSIMDIGDFARQDSSYVIYENFINNRVIQNTPELFPNLFISNDNWGANNHDFTFARNITTTGNLELLGNVNLVLPNGATGDITIGRNLIMLVNQESGSWAEIGYPNTGTVRKVVVKGDLIMNNASSIINVRNPSGNSSLEHELHIGGNIIQGSASYASTGLRLWTASNRTRITLYLDGSENMTYNRVNGDIPQLYRLVVNKGNSPATTARFNTDFVLNGPTSGAGTAKALELQNGTFIYNNPNASRTLVLTSGNDYFSIPSAAGLEIVNGTVRASGSSGISLDGILTISGGNLDMSGGDNPVEYSSSGNATINISSGTLTVGGQIRRSPTSEVGILKYNQSGGTVIVGNNAATVNNRGLFEILNPGSSFTMTGGDLYIVRSQNNPSVAAFYFDPETWSFGTAGNIHIGYSNTPATQTIGVHAGKPLPRLRINNSSSRNPVARLVTVPATISGLLQIDAGATLNANGLDLTLNGDLYATGTYIPAGNTTYFSGSSTQTINGGGTPVTFHNLDKNSSGNLVLNSANTPLTIENNFMLRSGTLTDNGNTVIVRGNMLNDALHINSGTGDGIVMNGTGTQQLTGTGTFGKLTIRNTKGVNIPVGNQISISRSLKMEAGVLNISSNLLDIGVNAVIEEASPFSSSNMIETNISFTDNGLRKTFRAGSSPTFVYPIGSGDKYTPVTLDITANGNGTGSITVKPANEMHPGIVEDTESGIQIVDSLNALQYYWTLKAEGISGFSGIARMYYEDIDVKVTPPYTIADYYTASLPADGAGQWLKFSKNDFDEANRRLIYRFSGTNDQGISGDYTAGAGDTNLNGAIPDLVLRYETVSSGNWSAGTIWSPVVPGGPRGAIARVNTPHSVDVTENNLSLYMTEIFGTLSLNSTYGHRLGIINGTGTLYLQRGEVPAAVYDNFFSPAGGTLEFGGTGSYDILGNIPVVNNLTLSGNGERRLPNNNLTIYGDLTISGSSSLTLINTNNKRINILGNMTLGTGLFKAGTGENATLAFTGSTLQTISGLFTGNNKLNNLEISNNGNVIIADAVEINRELRLFNGRLDVPVGTTLKLNYGSSVSPAAGSAQSYVNGTLITEMMNGYSFTFPIGSYTTVSAWGPVTLNTINGPSGIHEWKATYHFANPSLAGFNTSNFRTPVSTVSNTEYWVVEAPTGGSSVISFALNGFSDVASTVTDLATLRIVGWNESEYQWEVVGSGAIVNGTALSGTITTTTAVDFDNYSHFTIASVTPVAIGTATITTPAAVDLCNGSSTTITVNFSGEMPYVLTYTAGATTITTSAINSSSYDITVSPSTTTLYTITGLTANGVPGFLTGTTSVTVNVTPIPTVNLSRSGSGTICEGSSITFTATAGLANYNFRVNGITVQNGTSRTYTTTTLPPGSQSVDVTGTNAGGCSATSSAISVTVNPLPSAAGAITGPVSVCNNSTYTYMVPAIENATSYVWSVTGGTVTGSGNSVSITFTSPENRVVTVYGRNSCGNGAVATLTVAVSTHSQPGNAGTISGPSRVCRGGTGYEYTVGPVANATSYIWQYTGTGAVINGTGNSVTIDFLPGATAGSLRVAGTNGCATGGYSANYAIVVNPSPTASIIPANPTACGGSDLALTTTATGGATPFQHSWSGTGAAYLSSASVSNPLFNSPDGGLFDLTYVVTDNNGCTGTAYATVTVYPAPVASAGPDLVDLCTGTSQIVMTGASASGTYGGTPSWSGAGGTWTQNPDPALAAFTPSTPSGSTIATLTLTGANGCASVTDTRIISWNSPPAQPGAFTQSAAATCQGQSGVVYTVPFDPRADSYIWSYTGTGATITGTGNSITISFSATATSGNLSVAATNVCGTSSLRTMTVTVNIPPVATFIYPASPYCPNAPNPLPQFTAGGIAGTFSSTPGLVFVSTSTGEINLAASTPGDYTVTNTIAATGGCGIVTASATVSIIRDYLWTGAVNRDWNQAGNWSCGILPGAGNSVTIPDVANKPLLANGTIAAVNNLIIDEGSLLTVAGNTLRISGSLSGQGIIDALDGTIEFTGSSAQSVGAGVFRDNSLERLVVSNNAGVTLLGSLNVTGTLLVQNGSLASDGHLILTSDAAGTALIDGTGSGTVTGNVTMQRYLPTRFGYRYVSSPFIAATVNELADDMDLGFYFPLIYRYDESRSAAGWVAHTTPTAPLNPLEGYSVNFGSDDIPGTIDVTGVVNNGALSITLYNHNNQFTKGFNLVGNPYPSPIDWDAAGWTKNNIDDAIYFFRSSTIDEYGGSYSSYVNGVPSDGQASGIIPSMQGFFVHVVDGSYPVTGTLGVTNSVRINSHTTPFFKSASASSSHRFLLRLRTAFTDDPSSSDPMVIYFDEAAANDFEPAFDALKLFNTDMMVTNLYSVLSDERRLSINALPEQKDSVISVPLGLTTYRDGEVEFRLSDLENLPDDVRVLLSDNVTGTITDLLASETYRLNLPAGSYNERFSLGFFKRLTAIEPPVGEETVFRAWGRDQLLNAVVGALEGNEGVITIYDIGGRPVFVKRVYETGHYHIEVNLKQGLWLVNYTSGSLKTTEKVVMGIR